MSASERRNIRQPFSGCMQEKKPRRLPVAAYFSWTKVKSAAEQREDRYRADFTFNFH